MLAKRIIPCLDVRSGQVVKGVQFRHHRIVGGILALAERYQAQGADELVFYDITASTEQRTVDVAWVRKVAAHLSIPFCVAGGIRCVSEAETVLQYGADKISINSPALENPRLITQIAQAFGVQSVVVGVDSCYDPITETYWVYQYTGDEKKAVSTGRKTQDWLKEVQERGAGEIVLNCMRQDGMRAGYDITQLAQMRACVSVPLIASGGAGEAVHFKTVFEQAQVEGALAASVFHTQHLTIPAVKSYLQSQHITVRWR